MYSFTHFLTVKFLSLHSPLSSSTFTHPYPTQTFSSPTLIPHNQCTFVQFSHKLFHNKIYWFSNLDLDLDSYTLYQTFLVCTKLKHFTNVMITPCYIRHVYVFYNSNAAAIYRSSLTAGFPQQYYPLSQFSLSVYFPTCRYPAYYVSSSTEFPTCNYRNTALKFHAGL